MLPILQEIKDKLVKALNDQNDVDDATVMEIVSVLEKYPITRATLEETKIGKMVNDMRRKIKNEKLAKRVKQLVRSWKKILEETPPVNGGVPGPTHPSISQLRSSPAISPVLSRVSSAGSLTSILGKVSPALTKVSPALAKVSPALAKVSTIPSIPKQGAKKCSSPALACNRPVTGGSYRTLSPDMGTIEVPTHSTAAIQKVASPALSNVPSRVVSPALFACTASPTVPGRDLSPAMLGVEAKGVSCRMVSPSVSGRVPSPSLKAVIGQGKNKGSPLLAQSSVQSPELQCGLSNRHKLSSAADRNRLQKVSSVKVSSVIEVEDRVSPSTFHSESSVDRLGGEIDKSRQNSDDESSCRSSKADGIDNSQTLNHSITTLSLTSNNKNFKDQRELSKTNVANRKRAREISDTPQDDCNKRSRVDSPSLSANSHRHKVINGYTSKSDKKHIAAFSSVSFVRSGQVVSSHQLRTANEDSRSLPHSHSDNFLMIHENTDSNLSSQSFERLPRDKHKVKTTEQLIEELQKKNNGSKIGHTIMTKLRTNQIEQEQDIPGSVLPPGMKPRGKLGRPRKNEVTRVPSSNIRLSQVKSEMVERFLNTSDPASPLDEYSLFKDLPDLDQPVVGSKETQQASDSVRSRDSMNIASTSKESVSKEDTSKDSTSHSLASASHDERTGSALTLEEIYAQLPPIDYDIDWDAVDFFKLPEPIPVTEESVDCLHRERLPSVNGLYDINGCWTSWQQVVTLPSYEGNQLHILPYVDLDN